VQLLLLWIRAPGSIGPHQHAISERFRARASDSDPERASESEHLLESEQPKASKLERFIFYFLNLLVQEEYLP
jgi:hypothetical protein